MQVTVKNKMYDFSLTIVIDKDITPLYRKLCKKHGFDYNVKFVAGGVISGVMTRYYLLLSHDFLTYNTITHELYHLVSEIGHDRDIKEEESRAWIIGFLADQVFAFIHKSGLTVV